MLTAEQKAAILNRLNILLPGEEDEDLLGQLADDAAAQAEAWTGRASTADGMLKAVGDLALIAYNRRGTEGESSRSEGGESYSFLETPAGVYQALARFRLARTSGTKSEGSEGSEDA